MTQIVPHGTLDYAEVAALGLTPDDLIVFSSNINPYGPPPEVVAAIRDAATSKIISRYPDRLSLDLRARLAAHHAVAPESVLVGNGTADIMWLIGLLFARQKRVAILSPTFGEYENVVALWEDSTVTRACLHGWQRIVDPNRNEIFVPVDTTLEESVSALANAEPELVFLCNPNNPTGQLLSPAEFDRFYSAAPDALWVVDEAYGAFVAESWSAAEWIERRNLIVLRSMTKDFSLGGIRLGYAVAEQPIIAQLQTTQPPWNVNGLAQVAGIASMARLRQDCANLRSTLQNAGYAPLPTTTSYFLLPVDDASRVRNYLLRAKLMVRDCTSFGLPRHIRIAAQRPEQDQLLVTALTEYRQDMADVL